jgi:hypothetical protein
MYVSFPNCETSYPKACTHPVPKTQNAFESESPPDITKPLVLPLLLIIYEDAVKIDEYTHQLVMENKRVVFRKKRVANQCV